MQRATRLGIVLATALAAACGDETQKLDERISVENATPVGSIGGIVYDAVTGQPVADTQVTVTVIAGSQTFQATVSEDGTFSVEEVPASGAAQVLISAEGYLPAHLTAEFTNEAGQFPVSNAVVSLGPIGLVPATGSLAVRVVDAEGRPVGALRLTLATRVSYLLWNNGTPTGHGRWTTTAETDGNGLATFQSLPDYAGLGRAADSTVEITVPPVDSDGDGVFEYEGSTFYFDGLRAPGPEYVIVLDPTYSATLRIDYSNVPSLETGSNLPVPSTIQPDEDIHVLFSLPVAEDSALVRMLTEDLSSTIQTEVSISGRSMVIRFPDGLQPGAKYHLQIHVVSTVGDRPVEGDFYAPVFTHTDDPVQIVSVQQENDPTKIHPDDIITFNQPIGTGTPSYNTFSGSNCVIWFGYDIDQSGSDQDTPAEQGADTCNLAGLAFVAVEPVPNLPGGRQSGFSTVWRIQYPQNATYQFPSGGNFTLKFSLLRNTSRLPITPEGNVVPDQAGRRP